MIFPIADAHCDFLYGAMEHGYDLGSQRREQVTTLKHLRGGHVALQCFAVWTDENLRLSPELQALSMIDAYHRMLEKYADDLTPFSADYTPQSGKIATLLTIEGGECIAAGKAVLRNFYRLGARALALTWNTDNELAGAAAGRKQKGLTSLGREILAEMNAIGMALDVSHLCDEGIEDALHLSSLPVYASHSNARTLCGAKRCISDEHIAAIAARGGVIGVNFYGPQLTGSKACAIADIVRHILHMIRVGGVGCCCLGSDFDGMTSYPKDLKNALDFHRLCRALQEAGLRDVDIYAIAYGNLSGYLKRFV
ncbi:MAG: membrane dipeptidase [Clostridiales bacterium]|nr:membrane dipeptidase [Clostridiales bacterium]